MAKQTDRKNKSVFTIFFSAPSGPDYVPLSICSDIRAGLQLQQAPFQLTHPKKKHLMQPHAESVLALMGKL